MKAAGSELFWGLCLTQVVINPRTDEMIIMVPLLGGVMTLTVPGHPVSGT